MELPAWTFEALPKTFLYTAVLLIAGTAVNRAMLSALVPPPPNATARALDAVLDRLRAAVSGLAVAALLLRVIGHSAMVFGAREALLWSNIQLVAIESRWGKAWQLQLVAAAIVVLSDFGIRFHRRAGYILYTTGTAGLCAMIPRLGHGATSAGHFALHFLHLIAVSSWLGTLSVMALLYFRQWPDDLVSQIRLTLGRLFRNFSKIALPAAGLTVTTGIIAAWIYVGSFANLLATSYGRTLLVKIGVFAAVLVCGWRNWQRLRTAESPGTRTLIAELFFAAAVIVVTGVLTETEHP